jgi:predicted Ser/Thr protein kinase
MTEEDARATLGLFIANSSHEGQVHRAFAEVDQGTNSWVYEGQWGNRQALFKVRLRGPAAEEVRSLELTA